MEIFLRALLATAIVSASAVYLGIITDWKERDIKIGLTIAVICTIILLITIIVFNLDAQMAKQVDAKVLNTFDHLVVRVRFPLWVQLVINIKINLI